MGTGMPDCTWTYEEAGELNIDELVGITPKYRSHKDFCAAGCLEYVKYGVGVDHGKCIHWWDKKKDDERNMWRIEKTDRMFKAKYPDAVSDKELPIKCDFNYDSFYKHL